MKTFVKIYVILFCLSIGINVEAQRIGDLNGINYQAVAVDDEGKEIVGMDIEGKPLYEKEIGVRFTIRKGQDGVIQYQETHTALTDQYGLFTLTIGHGDQTGEGMYTDLLSIPWIDADQWLKVEVSVENDGDYKVVSFQQFMSVPYSFYTDDIADDAITTEKILNETILAEDIGTGSVETSEILDETILAEDIGTGSVTTSEILDETILAEDIATGSVTTSEILDSTIVNQDLATGSVDSRSILNESIQSDDIGSGSVTTDEILDLTIVNEDIAEGTINLSTKVTDTLAVENGGTGTGSLTDGGLLIGGGTNPVKSLPQATDGQIPVGVTTSDPVLKLLTGGIGISVTQTADSVIISSGVQGVNSSSAGNVQIGDPGTGSCAGERELLAGDTWISPSIPLPGVEPGNIIVGSVNDNLNGCMMSTYVTTDNQIRVSIFNGTSAKVCFISNAELRVLVVQ